MTLDLKALSAQLLAILCVPAIVCHEIETTYNVSPDLYLLVLAPFPNQNKNPSFTQGPSIIPAVELAVQQINNSSKFLQNHTLGIIVGDSGCNFFTRTTIPFVEHVVSSKKPVLGIIGPTCTESAVFLADITKQNRFGIIQATMANTDVLENHQEHYRHTFGMISSFNLLVDTLLEIAEEQSWEKIGVIYDLSREYFQAIMNSFINRSKSVNITIMSWPIFVESDVFLPLDEIMNSTRIIFAVLSTKTARHVACLAGIEGITFPRYQFVYTEKGVEDFLNNESDFSFGNLKEYHCNKKNIAKGLNGSILINFGLNSTNSDTFLNETAQAIVGEVKSQYREKLREQEKKIGKELVESVYAYPYYDATWAFAKSIDEALKEHSNFTQSNLRFVNNSPEAETLRQKFAALDFQGVTTRIQFDSKTGHVTSKVDILQVNGMAVIRNNITYSCDEFEVDNVRLHKALLVFGLIFSLLALVVTVVLHAVNFYYRDYCTVKASSPRLNHFIFLACYLIIFSVIFQTIHYGFFTHVDDKSTQQVLCNSTDWLNHVCLTLIIGTVMVKLWRLYSIFNRSFKKQHLLEDKYLAIVVLLLVLIGIISNIPWLVLDPFEEKKTVHFTRSPQVVKHVSVICLPSNSPAILPTIPYTFNLVLVTFMFWLAYLNRKIRLSEYRSKESIVFAYLFTLTVIVAGAYITVVYLLQLGVDAVYSAFAVVYLFVVFLCNFVLFVPPFYPVLKSKLTKRDHKLSIRKTMSNDLILKRNVP